MNSYLITDREIERELKKMIYNLLTKSDLTDNEIKLLTALLSIYKK